MREVSQTGDDSIFATAAAVPPSTPPPAALPRPSRAAAHAQLFKFGSLGNLSDYYLSLSLSKSLPGVYNTSLSSKVSRKVIRSEEVEELKLISVGVGWRCCKHCDECNLCRTSADAISFTSCVCVCVRVCVCVCVCMRVCVYL